jgi:hypothetical protein
MTSTELSTASTPLERLELILNHIGLPSYREPRSEAVPFEYLLIALDENLEKEPEYFLKLIFLEDILHTPDEEGNPTAFPESLDRFATLQYYLEIPVKIPTPRLLDSYRLVSAFSSLIPNGGLVINETEENTVVYFSHTLLLRSQVLDPGLAIELIEQTRYFLNRFLPQIQKFTTGTLSLTEILNQTQSLMVAQHP